MRFEWDERKNAANIAKHGFDFVDAERIFDLPLLVDPDERNDYGEDRWIGHWCSLIFSHKAMLGAG